MKEKTASQRLLKYDVIRIFALLSVVMVHVSAYMVLSHPDPATKEFIVGNIFNGISRAGVPLFVMLSGALLLNEEKKFDTKAFYKKSLSAMVYLLIGWVLFYGVFYSVILPLMKSESVSIEKLWSFILTFKGSDYPHLWYMFMVVGLYITIPVLRLFVKKENVKFIVGIMVASIAVQFVPHMLDIFTVNAEISVSDFVGKFHSEPCTGYIGYLLAGWLFSNYQLQRKHRIAIYALGLASLIGSTLAVQLLIMDIDSVRSYTYDQLTLPAMLFGCACFVFFSSVINERKTKSLLVKNLSNLSFGVYIIHVVVLEILVQVILPYSSFALKNPLVYFLITYIVVISVSYLVVFAVSKLKYIKRIFYVK